MRICFTSIQHRLTALPSYIDPTYTREQAHELYYDSHIDALQALVSALIVLLLALLIYLLQKTQIDPGNVFTSWPQAFVA